jgi:hypothetical protein
MKVSDLSVLVRRAREKRSQSACVAAVLVAYAEHFKGMSPLEVCATLEIADTYKDHVRMLLQVPTELEAIGFKVTNVLVKEG